MSDILDEHGRIVWSDEHVFMLFCVKKLRTAEATDITFGVTQQRYFGRQSHMLIAIGSPDVNNSACHTVTALA